MQMFLISLLLSYSRGIQFHYINPSYQDRQRCGSSLFKIIRFPCGILTSSTAHTGQSSGLIQSSDSSSSIFPVSKQHSSIKMPIFMNRKTNHCIYLAKKIKNNTPQTQKNPACVIITACLTQRSISLFHNHFYLDIGST